MLQYFNIYIFYSFYRRPKNSTRTDPVEVFCRIRPVSGDSEDSCLKILDDTTLMLQIPEVTCPSLNSSLIILI
jgi:hypothetical protein